MAEGDVRQYFVRNDQGTIWGPLALSTIELLIDNGSIQGRIQVSEDGINFAFPGRFPHLRDSFPRELWGDVVAPGPSTSTAPATPPAPQPGTPPGAPAAGPVGVPMAGPGATAPARRPPAGAPAPGPGAVPAAARPGAPVAGPGVPRAPAPAGAPMPGPGAAPTAARPGAPVAGPGVPRAPAPAGAPTPGPGTIPAAARPVTAPPSPAPAPPAPAQAAAPGAEELPPASGQLETHSPVRLYGLLAAGNHTGLLSLALADCTVGIHFRKGNPEFIDSSHPEDALGAWLLQAKLVTAEQLQQAEAARGRFGGEVLAALFGLGLLQPASAFTQLAHRAQSILLKGLRAESGTFTFEARELPAAKAMPLGNKWAVLSDLVRRIPSTDLRRRLQPVLNLPVMKSNGRVPTGDLRLTPHEVRVLALIDGVRSVGQLLTDIPQDAEHLLRLVFLLQELEGVSFAAQRAAPPPQAAAPRPAPPPAAAQPAAPQAAARPASPPPAAPAAPPQAAAKPATTATNIPVAKPATTATNIPVAKPATTGTATPTAKPATTATNIPVAKPATTGTATPTAKPATTATNIPVAKPATTGTNIPVAKPAAPASAPAAPGATPAATNDLPALRELAAQLKEQNHFERLGLGADTPGPAVKLAYFKLAKLYHPDTLPPGAPPELEKLKADIFGYIGDAYRTLSDDKSRAAYIEELKSGGGQQESQVDVEAILKSEELFRKSGHYIKARRFADAVKLLDEAIQLNPEEPEFFAWRGYARFFTFEDKKVGYTEAYRDLQHCLKKNEKVASAHYFLGVIAKLCGDNHGALKHFQKTVEIQPNHIDAQREIRMAAQKK